MRMERVRGKKTMRSVDNTIAYHLSSALNVEVGNTFVERLCVKGGRGGGRGSEFPMLLVSQFMDEPLIGDKVFLGSRSYSCRMRCVCFASC